MFTYDLSAQCNYTSSEHRVKNQNFAEHNLKKDGSVQRVELRISKNSAAVNTISVFEIITTIVFNTNYGIGFVKGRQQKWINMMIVLVVDEASELECLALNCIFTLVGHNQMEKRTTLLWKNVVGIKTTPKRQNGINENKAEVNEFICFLQYLDDCDNND